jgi:hypothetical protein
MRSLRPQGQSFSKGDIWGFFLVSCPGNKFQDLSITVVPVQSHLAHSVSILGTPESQNAQCRSQKALDMSQLWKVLLGQHTIYPLSYQVSKL